MDKNRTQFDTAEHGFQYLGDPKQAPALAKLLISELRSGDVVLDVRRAQIITTAFCSPLFVEIFAALPAEDVRDRLSFCTPNETQREAIRRSLSVVRRNTGDNKPLDASADTSIF